MLVVHVPDRPVPARVRVDRRVSPAREPVFLRREREPPHHRLLDLPDDLAAGQAAQRVRLADQLGRRSACGRRSTATRPAWPRAGASRADRPAAPWPSAPASARHRSAGSAGQQRRPDPGELRVLGDRPAPPRRRARQVLHPAARPARPAAPPASPAAPAWPGSRPRCSRRRPAFVSPASRAVPSSSAASNAIRLRGRLPQVHLPRVPAQRLEPLDRVALHARPGRPAAPPGTGRRTRRSRNRSSTSSSRVAKRPISQPTASWRVPCSSVRWSTDVGS